MEARQLTRESILTKLDEMPSLPAIVYQLSKVINDPMSSINEVEKIMANDVGLTARVLRLVNSAYYAIPGGVGSLARAVAYIGFDTVNQLVLSASIVDALATKGPMVFDTNEFWIHSIGTAIASETVAKYLNHPIPADLFTAGLVHDIGKVALLIVEPAAMLEIVGMAAEEKCTYFEAETRLGYPAHTEIGYSLAKKWELPYLFQVSMHHHHTKDHHARTGLNADANRNVDIVFLANLFVHALKIGNSGHTQINGIPNDMMERLTLNPDTDLKKLLRQTKDNLDKASDMIRVLINGGAIR